MPEKIRVGRLGMTSDLSGEKWSGKLLPKPEKMMPKARIAKGMRHPSN
jgi:hypothetical protein